MAIATSMKTAAVVVVLMALVVAACGSAGRAPTTSSAPESTEAESAGAVELAMSYLDAVNARDIATVEGLADESVTLDWGPARSLAELEDAWAWEDAFTLTHTLDSCELTDTDLADSLTARCRLLVESDVAAAAGNESGYVCVDIETQDGAIVSVEGLDFSTGCDLNYWTFVFVPFSDWLIEAHPGITVEEMYEDRTSVEGLELWSEYTQQYLSDISHSGG